MFLCKNILALKMTLNQLVYYVVQIKVETGLTKNVVTIGLTTSHIQL